MKTNHSVLLLLVFMFMVFMPGCSDAQDVPLEVKEGYGRLPSGTPFESIDITCVVDNITIEGLSINRKEIPAMIKITPDAEGIKRFPRSLTYGDVFAYPAKHGTVREVQVVTDKGSWTFQLR